MAIKCGFFNSVNKDRLYKAEEMTRPYELLVSNGVFATQEGKPSTQLQVYANSGMTIKVLAGRGIFKDKWLINDADLSLTVSTAEVTLARIDSVIVRIDTSESVRTGTIVVKEGTPASSPTAPVMVRSDTIYEYRLADILVNPGVTAITQTNITDRRGSADCPWVTSLVQQVDTSTLFEQFQAGFDEWFANVKETLATATLIRSYESTYTTTTQDETTIPINISQFNRNLDILQVYINGLMLIKDEEYTITDNSYIELTGGVDTGTPVSFVVYKSIDGSDAETVVQQVYDLQTQMNTILNGNLTSFNVKGPIRVNGVQGVYSDTDNTNVQVGSTACDTVIHGKDDVYLNVRANTQSLIPNANASYQIGNTSLRYNGIYLVNSPNVSSDRRMKIDIEDIDPVGALTFIDLLNVVHYKYKSDPETERIGLIAQDVYDVGGDKYIEVDEDGYYSLKPMDLIYPVIASVQQLVRWNNDLQEQIQTLEERIQALEK